MRPMVSPQVKIVIAKYENQVALVATPEGAAEMGVKAGDKLTLKAWGGTPVVRGGSGLAQAQGAGAPWRSISFDQGLHGVPGVTRVEPPLA